MNTSKGRLRKLIELVFALGFILGGLWLMILWDNDSLSVVWDDPLSIFWHQANAKGGHKIFWSLGPLLFFIGVCWIAEDWFGFGREDYAADFALPPGKPPALRAIGHAPREPPS